MNRVRGDTIASGDLLQSIINKGRKIVVATPDSEEARFLDYFGANASVNTGDINQMIVRPDVLKIEILEEFLHGNPTILISQLTKNLEIEWSENQFVGAT